VSDPPEEPPTGYNLVNRVFTSRAVVIPACGRARTACGASEAYCGKYSVFNDIRKTYAIPSDPSLWPYFLYIGGESFPAFAYVDAARKDEFETLLLKIVPAQQWIGVLVAFYANGYDSSNVDLSTATYESLDFVSSGSSNVDLSTATYESPDFVEEELGLQQIKANLEYTGISVDLNTVVIQTFESVTEENCSLNYSGVEINLREVVLSESFVISSDTPSLAYENPTIGLKTVVKRETFSINESEPSLEYNFSSINLKTVVTQNSSSISENPSALNYEGTTISLETV
jgi:hypothetical protein